ncbi:MAG: hypothetical protein NTV21_12880 [Planctomycetota bacterium]|nr:hypothetical protein [Planctomycetota bacterium]
METTTPPIDNEVSAVEFLEPKIEPPRAEPAWRSVRVRLEGLPELPETDEELRNDDCAVVAWEMFGPDGHRSADLEPISDGSIEIDLRGTLRDAERLHILSASCRGRRFRPVAGSEWLSLGTEGEPVAQFERAPVTSLVVKNDVTGELISPVQLRLDGGDEPFSYIKEYVIDPIYETREEWCSRAAQPIVLEALVPAVIGQGGRVNWRVRGEGFAERRISVALDSGSTHELRLAPVASVQVKWYVPEVLEEVGARSDLRLSIVLDPTSATDAKSGAQDVVRELPSRTFEHLTPRFGSDERGAYRWLELPRIAAGRHQLELRLPRQGAVDETLLAKASFVVAEGEAAKVELVDSFAADALPARLSLDFGIPDDYGAARRAVVTLERTGDSQWGSTRCTLDFDPVSGRTSSVYLSSGTYELDLSGELTFHAQIRVDGGITERRRIELPAPTRFRVRFVADRGGELGLPQAFPWSACFGSANSRNFIAICEKGVPGTFELRSPSDQIELQPPRDGSFHFVGGATKRLTGGGEHLVQLVRAPRVRLQLFRDGRRIAIPLGLKVIKRKSSDPSRPESDGLPPQQVVRPAPGTPEELQLWFPGPGTYELHLSSLEGYAPLPRVLVRVGASDDRLIELPLVVER